MTEPEESLAAIEDEREKFNNEPLLIEPKEESLDDFLSAAVEQEASNQLLDNFPSFPENQIPPLNYLNENDRKKEEMLENAEILASYGAVEKSEENDISSQSPVEPKLEVLEDRVVIAVENPDGLKFFDDFNDEPLNETFADYPEGNHSSSMEESDSEDDQPMMKKSRLDSITKKIKRNVTKRSDTAMKCTECEFSTILVRSFVNHIRFKHDTTLAVAGIALRCECGHESFSANHILTCNIANFTVIRKTVPPKRQKYPTSTYSYANHLAHSHKSTLRANGIYLLCACGKEVRSHHHDTHNNTECDGREFSMRIFGKVNNTTKCIMCEKYPSTVQGYADHLNYKHKCTLLMKGIFLRCACGHEVLTNVRTEVERNNIKECDGREYTLHKLDEKVRSTPQCVMCETYPKTALSYAEHISSQHNSTLYKNQIFLRCSCGYEIRSQHLRSKHNKKCGGRQFTLHKLDEE